MNIINLSDYRRKPRKPEKSTMDAEFSNHGTVWLCRPVTKAARAWIEDHISADAPWFGITLAIDARYVQDIVNGMAEDGLDVRAS